ncbi:hypothetical protein GCK72_000087 [Caenorhabditis remanei]|uniref:Piwi domain-containing protein n=1 Tax=Caenorhabditis remanei TaxID=31234 RepID=A0A6A5HL58_CAERE|nr:hypothetical protein GCK72_000087 [Caenorhabditis remanei]KAF1768275.1 hypothetical protein GCK72_000087 [Caenorhabditis remanei]
MAAESMDNAQTINIFYTIIRRCLDELSLTQLGRHYFNSKDARHVREYNMSILLRFETAIRIYEDQLMLCIENRFKMVRRDSMYDLVKKEMQACQGNRQRVQEKMNEMFGCSTIITLYNNKLHRFTRLDWSSHVSHQDGAVDGQIPYNKNTEVKLVRDACDMVTERVAKLSGKVHKSIKLAFIFVTKRVNMRILKQGATRASAINPDPGTVVDTVVTRPERMDFYLVPQFVNQGTVTPVSYNIIFDDTELGPDKHQQLAFKLCYLYYNWQGTVRVPAPCQYAHKLAFLTAQSLHGDSDEKLCDKLFFLENFRTYNAIGSLRFIVEQLDGIISQLVQHLSCLLIRVHLRTLPILSILRRHQKNHLDILLMKFNLNPQEMLKRIPVAPASPPSSGSNPWL